MGRSILLLCVLCFLAVIPSEAQPQKCSHLLVRKEWRTLTYSEKTEWVAAVKVRVLFPVPKVRWYIAYAE